MNYHFDLNQADLPAIVAMLLVTVCFCTYWFLFTSARVKQSFYNRYPGDEGKIRHIISLKYIGFVMFAIIPVLFFKLIFPGYGLASLGFSFNPGTANDSLLWILCLGLPVIGMMRLTCRRPNAFECYPQIRVDVWDIKLVLKYCTSWAFYMTGYEILFRGLLLFPLVHRFGVLPAIAINTIFYASSHIPKGSAETYSTLFFGPLLCFITLQTGNIWAASVIHIILAIANSMMALAFNPKMIIVKNRQVVQGVKNGHINLIDA
jgi:membrane protease YdiL (CAAX protease family)